MTPLPDPRADREALLQAALDGGEAMSERELAAFARALIADGAFAEDYLVSRRMLDDLALLQEPEDAPDIADKVMARLSEAAPEAPAVRIAAPALGGWLAVAAAGMALAVAGGFFIAGDPAAAAIGGLDALAEAPGRLWDALGGWSPGLAAGGLAPYQLGLAAGEAALLAVFSNGWALAARTSSSRPHAAGKGR
jgi:hypothetical protein